MTISSETRLIRYTGNGATTAFPYTFYIPDTDSVEVSVVTIADGTTEVIDPADYTITGVGEVTFGSVTYPLVGSPLSSSYYLIIKRVVAYKQSLDVTGQDTYNPALLEEQLDLIVMQTQQLAEEQSRNLVGQPGESFSSTLPPKAALAEQVLGFDAAGEPKAVTVASMGSVALPPSSTDNHFMKWDGTGADNIQNAQLTEDDSGNVTGINDLTISGTFTGSIALSGTVAIAGTASAGAAISLGEDTDNGTNTITLQAPSSIAANFTLTLPHADGTAFYGLGTDGSGALGWYAFARTDAANEWSMGQGLARGSIAYAATITPDLTDGYPDKKYGTLTGGMTYNLPTGVSYVGESWIGRFTQDGTGSRAITFDANYYQTPLTATTADYMDIVMFTVDQIAQALTCTSMADGEFTVGETVTGGTSGSTATVVAEALSGVLLVKDASGAFTATETITGGTSSDTATFVSEAVSDTAGSVLCNALYSGPKF